MRHSRGTHKLWLNQCTPWTDGSPSIWYLRITSHQRWKDSEYYRPCCIQWTQQCECHDNKRRYHEILHTLKGPPSQLLRLMCITFVPVLSTSSPRVELTWDRWLFGIKEVNFTDTRYRQIYMRIFHFRRFGEFLTPENITKLISLLVTKLLEIFVNENFSAPSLRTECKTVSHKTFHLITKTLVVLITRNSAKWKMFA